MKKIIIFLAIIIVLFAALFAVTKMQEDKKLKADNNPYGTKDLKSSTIDQLDDPNYQNIILPDQLKKKLETDDNVTVYFYSPECSHCKATTPVVAPLAENMGIDLVQYNLLEFQEGFNEYQIEYTPTIVHYKNGVEEERIVGSHDENTFRDWFEENDIN